MSHSPADGKPSGDYETAWAAITELINGEGSWSSRERNICYLNNRDGTFTDVSGALGLDYIEDGRAFAVADFDRDGDLDLILKSRNEPGLRLIRNDFGGSAHAVSFALRGRKSNRDAIGARVTVFAAGKSVSRSLRAGSGFLSQHSKKVFFGLGTAKKIDKVTIEWPSGTVQELLDFPVGGRVTVEERSGEVGFEPFAPSAGGGAPRVSVEAANPGATGTWLVEPLASPDFDLVDVDGHRRRLGDYRGSPLLINFWATWCPPCRGELRHFQENREQIERAGIALIAVAVNEPGEEAAVKQFARDERLEFPVLLGERKFLGMYNLLKRYLFSRRLDLQIPTTLLLNARGEIEKIYEGPLEISRVLGDLPFLSEPVRKRWTRALPFRGRFYGPHPRRNYAELGTAFYKRGFLDPSLPFLRKSAEVTPSDPDVHFNLGTVFFSKGALAQARASFERAVGLKEAYPEAHNSLGVVLARLGQHQEAIVEFQAALDARPSYSKAIGNVATAYLQSGRHDLAIETLEDAVGSDPANVSLLNRLGVLQGRQGRLEQARSLFHQALKARPGDPKTVNNLALLEAAQGNTAEAISRLVRSLEERPDFEKTYLVLAEIFGRSKELAKARDVLQKLLVRNPSNEQLKRMLRRLTP